MLRAFFSEPGALSPTQRRALVEAGAAQATGSTAAAPPVGVVADLRGYAEKVARYAYRVVDEDVAALKALGHSEDAVYEATIAGALGGSLPRLQRGLALLGDTDGGARCG